MRRRTSSQKGPALLPPYTTGIVRIRSNLDIKLERVIGGWQWRAADRRCASRCGHSSRRASGLGVAFVGAFCRRIDSQGVDPRSLNWKISSPGKSTGPKPNALDSSATTLGRPLVWVRIAGCSWCGRPLKNESGTTGDSSARAADGASQKRTRHWRRVPSLGRKRQHN